MCWRNEKDRPTNHPHQCLANLSQPQAGFVITGTSASRLKINCRLQTTREDSHWPGSVNSDVLAKARPKHPLEINTVSSEERQRRSACSVSDGAFLKSAPRRLLTDWFVAAWQIIWSLEELVTYPKTAWRALSCSLQEVEWRTSKLFKVFSGTVGQPAYYVRSESVIGVLLLIRTIYVCQSRVPCFSFTLQYKTTSS